jgi:hypothetical protein
MGHLELGRLQKVRGLGAGEICPRLRFGGGLKGSCWFHHPWPTPTRYLKRVADSSTRQLAQRDTFLLYHIIPTIYY